MPWGMLEWQGEGTIPAKDMADENQVSLVWNVPSNFAFRLERMVVQVYGVSNGALTDLQPGMLSRVVAPSILGNTQSPGDIFIMKDNSFRPTAEINSFKFAFDTITNDFMSQYDPVQLPSRVYNTGGIGTGAVLMFLLDSTADATSAFTLRMNGLASLFTVEQYIAGRVNNPLYVTP